MQTRTSSTAASWLVVALTVVGLLRALLLWSHEPLYAYANTYDQTRYSACFDIYPDRPAAVPLDENSPNAPYASFRFADARAPMCYWSSELAFTALTAAVWHIAEWGGAGPVHSVRVIGALKLVALLILSCALSIAWLRRRRNVAAMLNAALLPLLFSDPGNTLYLNTFYAEWTALLAAYALFALVLLWHGEHASRMRFLVLAASAVLLAASKMQHLVLPLSLAIALLMLTRWRNGRASWQAIALVCGAVVGGGFQFAQMQREGPMMDSIRQFNRAHVIFTALLPVAENQRVFLEEIGVNPDCVQYSGKHAWEMPGMPETLCPGVLGFGYMKQLSVLLTHPQMTLRLARRAAFALDPWIAENIGQVEGEVLAEIPHSMFTLGMPLHRWPALQLGLLALPLFGLVVLLARRRIGAFANATDFSALIVVGMLAIVTITVLGDGLADTAKQGHLVVNAALAWLIIVVGNTLGRRYGDEGVKPGDVEKTRGSAM